MTKEIAEVEKLLLAANNPEQRRLLLKKLQELTAKETRVG